MTMAQPKGAQINAKTSGSYGRILTPQAIAFVAELHRAFAGERRRLLAARAERQKQFENGVPPDFLKATAAIRVGEWAARALPPDLLDRRVEVIGPADRKAIVDGLNSGARVFLADFEDALVPSWDNLMQGQASLIERWAGKLEYTDPASGRRHSLHRKVAVTMVRPRGWHRSEERLQVDGEACAASLFDFGLALFHNARAALEQGSGPYFSLPKIESHGEARLWNQVFVRAQSLLGLPLGTIRATVMIETVPATFEMDEIIHELRDHISALGCDRRNYLASMVRSVGPQQKSIPLHDNTAGIGAGYLGAQAALLIQTCHRRGILAIGEAATHRPSQLPAEGKKQALRSLEADKEWEAILGFDGTAAAHGELVPVVMKVFNNLMPTANQLYVRRDDEEIGRRALLDFPMGEPTEEAFGRAVSTCLKGLLARFRGQGRFDVDDRICSLADIEVARSALWFWLKHGAMLANGTKANRKLFERYLAEKTSEITAALRPVKIRSDHLEDAQELLRELVKSTKFEPFVTSADAREMA